MLVSVAASRAAWRFLRRVYLRETFAEAGRLVDPWDRHHKGAFRPQLDVRS